LIALAALVPATALAQNDSLADHFAAGMAALSRQQFQEAAVELKQIPQNHPGYGLGMARLAYDVYTVGLNQANDGLPYARLALEAAPDNPEVARAFVKTHV
jgi:hypothetical protein